MKFERVRF